MAMAQTYQTRIGHSQMLRSRERLSDAEEDLLKSYLNGDYTRVRQTIGRDAATRRLVHKMFETKGLRSIQRIVVYRSQTAPFDTGIGTQSIISSVLESQYADRFGSFRYVFLIEPNTPFIEIVWNLGSNQGQFTEIILPMNGFFAKSRSKGYDNFDTVFRFGTNPLSASPSSAKSASSSGRMNNVSPSAMQFMSLRGLEKFRSLPKYKQTKRALLHSLGYEDEFDLEIAGNTAEKEAYNNALSTSAVALTLSQVDAFKPDINPMQIDPLQDAPEAP